MNYSKRKFLKTAAMASVSVSPFIIKASPFKSSNQSVPTLDPDLVREFVRVAHSDFGQVQKMLEETPHLLNATQDWGDGDFESAIGAAGHMGLKDMSNYLIAKGARFDIFVLTMLGKTEIVKSWIELYPNLLQSIGPHGFTLLHHAEKGGEDAAELFDYLSGKGLTEKFIKTFKK